uniref:Uncharacterized protein n=1 Tax=Peronospora matthiolae TaxID=2874970 RepID=A0AAV1TEV7_9STRA
MWFAPSLISLIIGAALFTEASLSAALDVPKVLANITFNASVSQHEIGAPETAVSEERLHLVEAVAGVIEGLLPFRRNPEVQRLLETLGELDSIEAAFTKLGLGSIQLQSDVAIRLRAFSVSAKAVALSKETIADLETAIADRKKLRFDDLRIPVSRSAVAATDDELERLYVALTVNKNALANSESVLADSKRAVSNYFERAEFRAWYEHAKKASRVGTPEPTMYNVLYDTFDVREIAVMIESSLSEGSAIGQKLQNEEFDTWFNGFIILDKASACKMLRTAENVIEFKIPDSMIDKIGEKFELYCKDKRKGTFI